MTWQHVIYFITTIITLIVMAIISLYSLRKRKTVVIAGIYLWIALLVGLLSLFQGLSMIGPTMEWVLFWFNLRIVCFAAIPVIWIVFVLHYTGRNDLLSRPRIALMFIIPVITQIVLWTNDRHGLWAFRDVGFHRAGPFFLPVTAVRVPGPWYHVHTLYTYALMLTGLVVLLIMSVRMPPRHRRQAALIGAGTLIMVIGSLFPSFNLIPGMALNPLPQSFALGSLVIAWGLYRHRFLDDKPLIDQRKKIPVFLAALFMVLAAGIITTGFVYYSQYRDHYRVQVEKELSSIADLKVSEIVQWHNERLRDGSVCYKNDAFTSRVDLFLSNREDAGNRWRLYKWMDQIRTAFLYERVLLLDARGMALLTAPAGDRHVCDYILNSLPEIRRSGGISFIDFYRDAEGHPIELSVVVPVMYDRADAPVLGFLVLVIDPGLYLYPLIQRWPTPSETAETLLVRRDGNDALFLNELRFRKRSALTLRIPLTDLRIPAVRAVRGYEGLLEGIDYRGVPVLADVRPVPGTPWFMVARMDQDEVYAPVRERFWVMVIVVVTLIAGAGGGMGALWRRQDERIMLERLEAAETLRESEEKFSRAFQTSPYAITITSPEDGRFIDVNDAFHAITGYTRDDIAGASSTGLSLWVNEEDRGRVVRELAAGGKVAGREFQFRKKSGDIITGLFSADIIPLESGRFILSSINDITDRKRMEEELRLATKRLSFAMQTARAGTWDWDIVTGHIEWSPQMYELFGLDPGTATASFDSWRSVLHPEDLDLAENRIDRALKERTFLNSDYRVVLADGRVRWINAVGEGIYDGRGTPLRMIGICLDISERKLAEKELRDSEDKFRVIFNDSTVGKSLIAPDGRLLQVNHALADMLGYTVEELQEVNFAEITHPDDIAESRECVRCLLAGERESYRMEKRYRHRNGGIVWADVGTRLHRGADGQPEYFMTGITNITDRKRAEEALQESERKLKEAQEMARLGYWNWDVKTGEVEWSEEVYRIFGLDREGFTPQIDSILALSPWPGHRERDRELIEKAVESHEAGSYEQKFLRPDKSIGYYYSNFQGVYDETGELITIVGTIMDITDRKLAEEELRRFADELERSNVDLQQFAYVASHDLQEPLRMITSYLQLIERRYKDRLDADADDFINFAVEGAARLQSLINGLLEFSRIRTHGRPFERVSVNDLLSGVRKDLELQIGESGATVSWGAMPVIRADQVQIARLFLNLVQNAVKFRREGVAPEIRISAEKRNNEDVFCVRDNGIGIEEQYKERIFVIYQRLHGREDYPGTGIGLSICKRIVERHGGRIWVESKPGEGSSFYFTIPAGSIGTPPLSPKGGTNEGAVSEA